MEPSHDESARPWMEQAADDLEVAEILLATDSPKPRAAAFHCQQAVEKYLKAFLVYHGRRPPYTHSLEALLDLAVEHESSLDALYEVVEPLAPFAVAVRYPGTDVSATEEEAAVALQHARRRVREVVRSRLSL